MNVTRRSLLASENGSTDWNNSTVTTASSPTSEPSNVVDWLTYLTGSVQWIVFVVGTVGNIMVLAVLLWRRRGSQVGTQLFVGSLAVADLGMMLSTTWVEAYYAFRDKNWHFGSIPCKLHVIWQWMTMNGSIWTLAALSIDRYMLKDCYDN